MKKIYTLGVVTLLFTKTIFSQTVINASDFNPSVGESFTTYSSAYVNPGASGDNITWNLSSMTNNSTISIAYSAANPNFPGTNLTQATNNQSFAYSNYANDGMYMHGILAGPTLISYQNVMKQFSFPMALNNFNEDNFNCTFTSGVDYYRFGTSSSLVDGSGTLITPEGTFTDVLRVHYIQNYKDSNDFQEINYSVEVYGWYKAGFHNELASVSSLSVNGGQPTLYGSYMETAGLGLTNENLNNISLYPNPAADNLVISLNNFSDFENFTVSDLQGKVQIVDFTKQENNLNLNVANLSSGIYFLNLNGLNKSNQTKFVIK